MASYDPLLDALYELEADNVSNPTAAILNPRTGRTINKLKDTTGQPLMRPAALADLPMLSTTSVAECTRRNRIYFKRSCLYATPCEQLICWRNRDRKF